LGSLHDNAPAHRSLSVQGYLAKHCTTVLSHPPYSPDLSPCDFNLFPKLKERLKGRHFANSEEVKEASKIALREVGKDGFQSCFQDLYARWQKCIVAEGDYFEGNCASC
jgi:[histone H3]-lysine36 N-dimethyltransferase SETMAR